MDKLQFFLIKTLLLSEFIAALVAVLMYRKFRHSYWKWFTFYLVFIFLAELNSEYILPYYENIRKYYFDFFIIPLEFIFFYWLYSYKSLGNKKLFWGCTFLYFLSFLPQAFIFDKLIVISSFNYVVGTFLLSLMILLEFNKQIKTDDILKYRKNMMFYINIGVCLFYIATLPFFSFYDLISKDSEIWFKYYVFL